MNDTIHYTMYYTIVRFDFLQVINKLEYYYVLEGTIFKSPSIFDLANSRLVYTYI